MSGIAFIHGASHSDLATIKDPALRAMGITEVYAPDLRPGGLDDFDGIYLAARLHPGVLARITPILLDFLAKPGARAYIDGENQVGTWLPGTTETRRGTNFWAWRIGEDVGRRSVNQDHPFWEGLAEDAVHWHYHGVLTHPASATALVKLVAVEGEQEVGGPVAMLGGMTASYRALEDHPNTLMYVDEQSFAASIVVSTMDASYHHGSGFMPGATQLLYRMFLWLRGAQSTAPTAPLANLAASAS